MNMNRSSFVVLAWLWLEAALAATTLSTAHASLRRHVGPSKEPKQTYVTYESLQGGRFEPDTGLVPATEDYVRREFHHRRIFYEGFPMYFAEPQGYNLQRMQRGYADFGKIYIAGRSLTGNPTLSIRQDSNGQPVTREASRDALEYAHDVLAARVTFGDTAALAAYGYKLAPAPHKKFLWFRMKPFAPGWNKVWNSLPRDRHTGLREARHLLNRDRFIRFMTADGISELGIRLLQDGRQHLQWRIETRNPFFSSLH